MISIERENRYGSTKSNDLEVNGNDRANSLISFVFLPEFTMIFGSDPPLVITLGIVKVDYTDPSSSSPSKSKGLILGTFGVGFIF